MCMRTEINYICSNEYEPFLSKSNVVGLHRGTKFSNGFDTGEECITVLVSQKVDASNLDIQDLIPCYYRNIKTDIIEVGEIKAQPQTALIRPMQFGYSIGPADLLLAGTAGCMVADNTSTYILSNNHVIAGENALPIGSNILQPGTIDGGINPANLVANLTKFIPIQFSTATTSPKNNVDCAIAKIVGTTLVSNTISLIGKVSGTNIRPSNGLNVKKSGRSTGLTTGLIQSTNATVQVTYSGGKTAVFVNQIITTAMSSPGDSGSLLLDSRNYAVGLLFAGSTSITIYNPIKTVLSALGVSIV